MLITEAMKRIRTGIIYRTDVDGHLLKVVLKDGKVTAVLIDDVVVDKGDGLEAGISIGIDDLFSDDWEAAQGY
ncbi:MAG: hypothetical protein JXB25_04210 [Deltaproteobacteria bacterium]|nr:hypothetical protein [Deltaproteobacteria bacterium]